MAVTIDVYGTQATISDRVWTSRNESLSGVLNALYDPTVFSGSCPDIDLAIARNAIELLGGVIVKSDPPQPIDEDVVY